MKLFLARNEQNIYELRLGDSVIAEATLLSDILPEAKAFAKRNAKSLYIAKSAVSDWYVGFPVEASQTPVVFFDSNFKSETHASTYRFVEGPFLNSDAAKETAFKITGQIASVESGEE